MWLNFLSFFTMARQRRKKDFIWENYGLSREIQSCWASKSRWNSILSYLGVWRSQHRISEYWQSRRSSKEDLCVRNSIYLLWILNWFIIVVTALMELCWRTSKEVFSSISEETGVIVNALLHLETRLCALESSRFVFRFLVSSFAKLYYSFIMF